MSDWLRSAWGPSPRSVCLWEAPMRSWVANSGKGLTRGMALRPRKGLVPWRGFSGVSAMKAEPPRVPARAPSRVPLPGASATREYGS
jgi:hypothetical protein